MDQNKETIKKTEKLATALYLLTSFFDDKEPMKWRLRELAGRLVAHAEMGHVVPEAMSLLTVAKQSGLISDMNFEVVHREFGKLLTHTLTLTDVLNHTSAPERIDEESGKEKIATKTEKSALYIASTSMNRPVEAVAPIKDILPPVKNLKEFGVVAVKKNSRQSIIVNLLKRKKEIMIKDVSPLIDGVSEKTIQRELLAMVKSGMLRKAGEKRWSRYSLAE